MRHIPSLTLCLLLTVLAAQAQRQTFDTPEEAAHALIAAAADNNSIELNAIFGPKGVAILTSGDAAQDKAERREFVSIARQKYQIEPDSMSRDRVILSIGDDDWPFPVPIVRANGKWSFDTTMGSTMLQARRIGADELDAIEICTGYVAAEMEYAQQHSGRQYAQRILSSPGKDDGLYSGGHGLVPKEFADSAADGVSALKPKRYHGYFFKVLTGQGPDAPGGQHDYLVKDTLLGGFALVAWPADYGVTGIHTFIVNQDGVVYESNLGHPANALAAPVDRFNPDANWRAVN